MTNNIDILILVSQYTAQIVIIITYTFSLCYIKSKNDFKFPLDLYFTTTFLEKTRKTGQYTDLLFDYNCVGFVLTAAMF